jgi:hypothetical protein
LFTFNLGGGGGFLKAVYHILLFTANKIWGWEGITKPRKGFGRNVTDLPLHLLGSAEDHNENFCQEIRHLDLDSNQVYPNIHVCFESIPLELNYTKYNKTMGHQ